MVTQDPELNHKLQHQTKRIFLDQWIYQYKPGKSLSCYLSKQYKYSYFFGHRQYSDYHKRLESLNYHQFGNFCSMSFQNHGNRKNRREYIYFDYYSLTRSSDRLHKPLLYYQLQQLQIHLQHLEY